MHELLKLQHHRHTGKRLAHRHTSYRVIFLLLFVTGIFLLGGHYATAHADDIIVTAKISAPIPTVPTVITSPPDGTVVSEPGITVSGTCQVMDPPVIVAIYRGSDLLGSTVCQADGTFSVNVVLAPGANPLVAKTVNITGDYGPDSNTVTVFYKPKVPLQPPPPVEGLPPGETGGAPGAGGAGPAQLIIRSQNAFLVFGPDKPARWQGRFDGGTPPYNLTIDWGDGLLETKDNLDNSEQVFIHRYRQMQPQFVQFVLRDAGGQSITYHFVSLTPYRTRLPVIAPTAPTSQFSFASLYLVYLLLIVLGGLTWYDAKSRRLIPLYSPAPKRRSKRKPKPRKRR